MMNLILIPDLLSLVYPYLSDRLVMMLFKMNREIFWENLEEREVISIKRKWINNYHIQSILPVVVREKDSSFGHFSASVRECVRKVRLIKERQISPFVHTIDLNILQQHFPKLTHLYCGYIGCHGDITTFHFLKYLDVGIRGNSSYNCTWLSSLTSLQSLVLPYSFNGIITKGDLPSSLCELTFGCEFNQKLEVGSIPAQVHTITFGQRFNQPLLSDVLPDSLKILEFGFCFEQCVEFPKLLHILKLHRCECHYLQKINLPSSLIELSFIPPKCYSHIVFSVQVDVLPIGLKILRFPRCSRVELKGVLPNSLRTLESGWVMGILPNSLSHLILYFSSDYIEGCLYIELPRTLQSLKIDRTMFYKFYSNKQDLPSTLKKIDFF